MLIIGYRDRTGYPRVSTVDPDHWQEVPLPVHPAYKVVPLDWDTMPFCVAAAMLRLVVGDDDAREYAKLFEHEVVRRFRPKGFSVWTEDIVSWLVERVGIGGH